MTDEQTIERLENQVDDLTDQLAREVQRAEDAEGLAQKYREALDDIRHSAQEAIR